MRKLMIISGKYYEEHPLIVGWEMLPSGECAGCALDDDHKRCAHAIDVAAPSTFGGDCETNNVIYNEVTE